MSVAIINTKEITGDESYPDFILEVIGQWDERNNRNLYTFVLHQVNEGNNQVNFNATIDRLMKSHDPKDTTALQAIELARKEATALASVEASSLRDYGDAHITDSPIARISLEYFQLATQQRFPELV
jgi:hypothetical protein